MREILKDLLSFNGANQAASKVTDRAFHFTQPFSYRDGDVTDKVIGSHQNSIIEAGLNSSEAHLQFGICKRSLSFLIKRRR